MKIRHHLPSLFTFINLFLGFLAILNVQAGHYELACYLIMTAGAFDAMDGKIARIFGLSSDFGIEIDSLADLVSFCLAPSILVYHLFTMGLPGITGEIIACAPLFFGAIRLARFNIAQSEKPSAYFVGLPTPAAAFAIAALVLWTEHIKSVNPEYTQPRLLLPIIFTLSFLMVSKLKYAKFPILSFKIDRANNLKICGIILFLMSFITAIFYNFETWVLLGFIMYYILGAVVRRIIKPKVVEETYKEYQDKVQDIED